jgi:hypothetical protein
MGRFAGGTQKIWIIIVLLLTLLLVLSTSPAFAGLVWSG